MVKLHFCIVPTTLQWKRIFKNSAVSTDALEGLFATIVTKPAASQMTQFLQHTSSYKENSYFL